MIKKLLIACMFLFFLLSLAAAGFLVWGYYYITRDLPQLSSIEDYRPDAVSSVYSRDGTLIAEFFEERRYPVKLKDVPDFVEEAFIAAEDASFYEHPGIDLISIIRAMIENFRAGRVKQGGSTITQQVVKNLLLTPEKKYKRKIKEAILSYRLEQRFSKDDILEMYLNQIFFGNTAYGVKAAAKLYFHKDLNELTLGEAAMLAGLPKAPTRYSPILNFEIAKRRQHYVLSQMVKARFITEEAAKEAEKQEIKVYKASYNNIYDAPYFVAELRKELKEKWPEFDIDRDGLKIYTTVDLTANHLVEAALKRGLRAIDKRRGWRGPAGFIADADLDRFIEQYRNKIPETIYPEQIYPALVTGRRSGRLFVTTGYHSGIVDVAAAEWAHRKVDSAGRVVWIKPDRVIRVGDIVEVSLPKKNVPRELKGEGVSREFSGQLRFQLDQTPELEGAVVMLDPHSGEVLAMVGGYDYRRSKFNRATQGMRQPGSAFKPIVYLAAIDRFGYTPSTIVYDMPRTFRVGDTVWEPGNFDDTFLGPITLRSALEKSRNLVSADIISKIGVDAAIQYARKLGIKSPLGENLSLSLGSSEVTLLELTRAYGVFAAGGVLFDTVLTREIIDRDGNIIYDAEKDKLKRAKQVVDENSAFIMANMMKGVVQHGTGYRARVLKRPIAAKTGTSNNMMDAWFIGYTPDLAAGVWVGFDQKKRIGEKETGGRAAAPIWVDFMGKYFNYRDKVEYEKLLKEAKAESERLGIDFTPPEKLEPLDFKVPDGVDPYWVNRHTGTLTDKDDPDGIFEYFRKGTEPPAATATSSATDYLESPDL
ncbi:MAG: PBP1A family penicillin-binding protein [Candidatus Dadabacteria bacterium]|nr:MAG: PBP1A family penicillin-binding protein [Candidatus Dadabacteria bacterium]